MSPKKDVVLFDGVCNLCNGAVHFILDRDPDERMQFASLQSEAGKELLRARGFPIPEGDPNSVLLVVGDRVYDGSGAALRIAARMSWPWKAFAVFLVVPWFLRDLGYYLIAKNRYRLFGKSEACRVPTPELRARFLT
jgi:predicted DCC family thiol-disulfide oxidoreductase YuxK